MKHPITDTELYKRATDIERGVRDKLTTALGPLALRADFPLGAEAYHAKSTALRIGSLRAHGVREWNLAHRKLMGAENLVEAGIRFLAGVDTVIAWVTLTRRIRTEADIVALSVDLALTRNLKGELFGVHCLVRVALADPISGASAKSALTLS